MGSFLRRTEVARIQDGYDCVCSHQPLPKYIVDAGPAGGVSRFVNHSCDPNLFVQPVLSRHHDEDLPHMAFFANSNIPPFTPLTCAFGMKRPVILT